jgi:hypothetical protein
LEVCTYVQNNFPCFTGPVVIMFTIVQLPDQL